MPNSADLSASPSPEVMRVLANLTAMILAGNNGSITSSNGTLYVQDYDEQVRARLHYVTQPCDVRHMTV